MSSEGPIYFRTAAGASINLDGWFAGRAVFLTLGGPSLIDMNLELLRRPGVITFGVNQSWATIRPRLWTCADPPEKFSDSGWNDPSIIKFVPDPLANSMLRTKIGKRFVRLPQRPCDMPSVFFFPRNARFEPADFLVQNSVTWGCDEDQTDPLGIKGIRSVMLQAIRISYALGFRTINLCGADFRMEEGKANYAFEQGRSKAAIEHNNRLYAALTTRFEALKPYFQIAGLRVFNCTPGSALTVFPFRRLSEAVAEAQEGCPEIDAAGWYESAPKPRPPEFAAVVGDWEYGEC